jgi:hypothetical protein
LFKLNLASLYSPNLILDDLLENIFLSCSADPFLSCSAHLFLVYCHSRFECVVTCVIDKLDIPFLCKGPSSTIVKTLFNISAQPQLLEVEGPGDVGIVKVELR